MEDNNYEEIKMPDNYRLGYGYNTLENKEFNSAIVLNLKIEKRTNISFKSQVTQKEDEVKKTQSNKAKINVPAKFVTASASVATNYDYFLSESDLLYIIDFSIIKETSSLETIIIQDDVFQQLSNKSLDINAFINQYGNNFIKKIDKGYLLRVFIKISCKNETTKKAVSSALSINAVAAQEVGAKLSAQLANIKKHHQLNIDIKFQQKGANTNLVPVSIDNFQQKLSDFLEKNVSEDSENQPLNILNCEYGCYTMATNAGNFFNNLAEATTYIGLIDDKIFKCEETIKKLSDFLALPNYPDDFNGLENNLELKKHFESYMTIKTNLEEKQNNLNTIKAQFNSFFNGGQDLLPAVEQLNNIIKELNQLKDNPSLTSIVSSIPIKTLKFNWESNAYRTENFSLYLVNHVSNYKFIFSDEGKELTPEQKENLKKLIKFKQVLESGKNKDVFDDLSNKNCYSSKALQDILDPTQPTQFNIKIKKTASLKNIDLNKLTVSLYCTKQIPRIENIDLLAKPTIILDDKMALSKPASKTSSKAEVEPEKTVQVAFGAPPERPQSISQSLAASARSGIFSKTSWKKAKHDEILDYEVIEKKDSEEEDWVVIDQCDFD